MKCINMQDYFNLLFGIIAGWGGKSVQDIGICRTRGGLQMRKRWKE